MTTQRQTSNEEVKLDDDNRARNARALQLVREWLAEDSDYDAQVFPVLKAELEADRLSFRRCFKERALAF
jgi:outer membrane biogenesis lipoprotein LolB